MARTERRRLGLICAPLLLSLTTAKGQEALYNALSLDASTAALNAAALQPDRPHWGPVQFDWGAFTGASYDDNINIAQNNPESDVILQEGINLGLDWPVTSQSDLQFGTGIGYLHYLKYSANDGLVITPDSVLTYAVSWPDANVILTFYDQISYTREVTAQAAIANESTLPQFGNTIGARVEWDPGQWTFQTSYGHSITLSDNAHEYLNSSSDYFYGRAGWRFAEETQAGLEASGSLTDYQVSSQPNNTSYSVGGYIEWQLLKSLQLTFRGGPAFYQYESTSPGGGNSSLNSYYISLAVNHQLTDFLSHSLQINNSVQSGVNQGSSYNEEFIASYTVEWALTQRISLGASVSYASGRQSYVQDEPIYFEGYLLGFVPTETTENYQQYGGGLNASWQFTGHLAASLNYDHTLRDSNLPDRGYTANSVSFQLNYRF